MVTTEIKTTINLDPLPAPPSVTVTVKLDDEQEEVDLYERCRIRNQKRAFRRQHAAEYGHERHSNSFDYSNSDLRNIINLGRDA